jgi:hypothetical protein
MANTTLSSREFGRRIGWAKAAAKGGPVFINDRGKPAYVFLTLENYQQLKGEQVSATSEKSSVAKSPPSSSSKKSIVDMLAMPRGTEYVEIEFPRLDIRLRPADFD